ncbi:MAG: NADH-dependent [FeFe] hydrogenase, group A6 [Clostridia bacterium]|nr:NADH-dependent [FeFe] hydrogenase, group A6 [Clostridia bacterium]
MDNLVKLTIDGVSVEVPAGTTVLEAAKQAGINIPTLCYLKDINQYGACRMCVVDTGARALGAACVLPVAPNMVVKTNTPKIRAARKTNLELLLSNHDMKCLNCTRNQNCELQQMCLDLGVENPERFAGKMNQYDIDDLSPSIVRNNNKCILCRRCVAACNKTQGVGVIGPVGRGFKTRIASPWDHPLNDMACINCGQCIAACPTGALYEKDSTKEVWDLLADTTKHVIVQPAPAVRAALGEEFGLPMGECVTGKMAAALRRMGFEKVFDTDWAADLTIMEEGTELLGRLKNGGVLPMITSCSPGWIKFCETYYPEFIPNLSSCKSPHEMEGAMIKSWWAEKEGIDPKDIRVVSVMPCTAKKFECKRPELGHDGMADVDAVITTRELARMIKEAGIDFANLPDEGFDPILGESTGAAVIFGTTGGVMEAALRTVYEVVTGETLQNVEFTAVRGIEGVKEASVQVGDLTVNVAVAHGTANAAKLLDSIKNGEKTYQFIEIMGCPGGCVTGGGQPIVSAQKRMECDPKQLRAAALYAEDAGKALRKSHESPAVKAVYDEFLGEPNSHKAHELLHTTYTAREKYSK